MKHEVIIGIKIIVNVRLNVLMNDSLSQRQLKCAFLSTRFINEGAALLLRSFEIKWS